MTERSVLPLLRCSGRNLSHLDLSGCWLLTIKALNGIVDSCPNLKHLDMSRCSGIVLEEALDILKGTQVAKNLKKLGIAYMGGVSHRVSRFNFERVAAKVEAFLSEHPHILVGQTQTFFRLCTRRLSEVPLNTDHSMCQAPYCNPGDGDDMMSTLQLLPRCSHIICLGCENLARGNVRTVHEQQEHTYLYPCPTCGCDMGPPSPCSKSFSIIL